MQNDMRDRLVKLIENSLPNDNKAWFMKDIEDMADHLIANGVILPPCKVGDTVYMVTLDGEIRDITVTNVSIRVSHWDTSYDIFGDYMVDNIKHIIAILPSKIGETVFLTKYQAEQKLKELRENG